MKMMHVMGVGVALFAAVMLFTVFKSAQTAQSTTTWSRSELGIWGLFGILFLLGVIFIAFKAVSSK